MKKTSQMQTDLLQGANASLKTYASEEKKKMQAIKNQRNVAYGVGAVLLYVPSEAIQKEIEFTMYSDKNTNEHIFTVHQGGITEEQMRKIFAEMGVE